MNKVIRKTEHEDGRKGVTVHVNTLDLNEPDAGDLAAKKVIEEKVLTKLASRTVLVTVIHKETLLKATVKTTVARVRMIAENLIAGFPSPVKGFVQGEHNPKDFIVVEVEGDDVRVTQL